MLLFEKQLYGFLHRLSLVGCVFLLSKAFGIFGVYEAHSWADRIPHFLGGMAIANLLQKPAFDRLTFVAFISVLWEIKEYYIDPEIFTWTYQNTIQDFVYGLSGALFFLCFKFAHDYRQYKPKCDNC